MKRAMVVIGVVCVLLGMISVPATNNDCSFSPTEKVFSERQEEAICGSFQQPIGQCDELFRGEKTGLSLDNMNLPQILSFMDDNEIEGKISVHVCCFIFGGDASGSTFLITARRILSLELLRISYMIMSPIMNLIPGEGPLDKIFYHLEFAWVLFPRFFSPTLCYLYCPSCRFCRTVVSSLCGSEDIEGAILFGFIGVTNVFGVIGFSPLALCFPSDIQSCHMA